MRQNKDELLRLLSRYYPEAHCALIHSNPFELLIATILSAQCTDERVNHVTRILFKKYPTPKSLAAANLKELEDDVRSTGFYKNKAKNIQLCAEKIISEHGGKVPRDLNALVQLPGVGRKTANVVLGNAFQIPSGIVVDTHVSRLSQRMGFTKEKTPEKIEKALMKIVPKDHWVQFSHELIFHGRRVCKARKPQCSTCFLSEVCPKRVK